MATLTHVHVQERKLATQQALAYLQEALALIDSDPMPFKHYKHIRNSAIRYFELSNDIFWEFLQAYFYFVHKIAVSPVALPMLIEEAVRVNLINKQESESCLVLLSTRAITAQTYNNACLAQKVVQELPQHYTLMHTVLERIIS